MNKVLTLKKIALLFLGSLLIIEYWHDYIKVPKFEQAKICATNVFEQAVQVQTSKGYALDNFHMSHYDEVDPRYKSPVYFFYWAYISGDDKNGHQIFVSVDRGCYSKASYRYYDTTRF